MIRDKYFEWLYDSMCEGRFNKGISYRSLFSLLHDTEFTWTILRDENRAEDGIDLRYRFACDSGYDSPYSISTCIDGPCSVLEMMVALAIRCEERLMCDQDVGDRTRQWFWGMITTLGLGAMHDDNYDERVAVRIIDRFLNREYSADGKGGLFRVKNYDHDLRDIEIWYQLNEFMKQIYE